MAPTSAEQGREVRQRLRRAAVELIAERGWRAVSTRLVAERAGVGAGLVHYHFASLDALLREAAVEAMRETEAGMDTLLEAAHGPRELIAMLLGVLDEYTGQDAMSTAFLETYLAATRDPALHADVAVIITGFRDRMAGWLAGHGVADPEAVATVLGAAVDGLVLHRGLDPRLGTSSVAAVLARLVGRTDGTDGTDDEEEE
jgi:AcrR family transcriptional regulator